MLPFQGSQRSFLVDMEQVRVSTSNASVTVTPYALPMCMTQHHIPVCTGAAPVPPVSVHAAVAQPTWSFPPCSVHIPACGMQHLPACISHHQVPLAHALAPHLTVAPPPPPPPPPHFHHHHHHHHNQSSSLLSQQQPQNQSLSSAPPQNLASSYQPPHHHTHQHHHQHHHHQQHHHHHQQQPPLQPSQSQHPPPPPPPLSASQHHHIISQSHVTPATHFVSAMPTLHRVQEETLTEPRFPYLNIPHLTNQQSGRHQPPPPPILLHDHIVHAIPHEFFGTLSRYRRVSSTRQRWRTIHPPPPPYPGFLLHFLAMLGRPQMTQYRMSLHNLHEDGTDLDNYEALLNLADRLGEAKPRGLTKCDIDLLPCYRFNQEIRRSLLDQSSCVICMCDFESRQLLRALPCFHEFHARCVDKWLKTNRTCPICRADAAERLKADSE